MKTSSTKNLATLVDGDSIIVSARKVAFDKADPSKGYKVSVELASFTPNPERPASAVSALNDDDDRFAQRKPQHAFQPMSVKKAVELGWIKQEAFDALEPSAGIDISEQVEGKHFISLNVINPSLDGKRLCVQVIETTEPTRKGLRAKINPSSGKVVTHGGKPVYRISQVAFEGAVNAFLPSDNTLSSIENKEATQTVAGMALNK